MEIDFREVKANFPIMKVCELLGLKLKPEAGGKYYRGECPTCGNERTFRVTPSANMCGCFKCKDTGVKDYSGDQLYLIAKVRKLKGPREAALWLMGDVGGTVRERPNPETGFKPLEYLEHDHPDVQLAGIEPEDAARIGIGHAPRGTLQGLIAIPIRLECGTLVGYLGAQDITPPKEWHFPPGKVVKFPKAG